VTSFDHTTVLETHAAVLFFVADRAYKLKKPVNLGSPSPAGRREFRGLGRRSVIAAALAADTDSWPEAHTVVTDDAPEHAVRDALGVTERLLHPAGTTLG
jgi:hypothetical protein